MLLVDASDRNNIIHMLLRAKSSEPLGCNWPDDLLANKVMFEDLIIDPKTKTLFKITKGLDTVCISYGDKTVNMPVEQLRGYYKQINNPT